MRKPESYLKEIDKLRQKHTANFNAEKWQHNDTIRNKIIVAWEGYHAAISRQLDVAGCATGNEHRTYSQAERINQLVNSRDYFMRQTDRSKTHLTEP